MWLSWKGIRAARVAQLRDLPPVQAGGVRQVPAHAADPLDAGGAAAGADRRQAPGRLPAGGADRELGREDELAARGFPKHRLVIRATSKD